MTNFELHTKTRESDTMRGSHDVLAGETGVSQKSIASSYKKE
jgi:hypothetical protein